MEQEDTVIAFNEAINNQDIEALSSLMSEEHTFIDTAGTSFAGKKGSVKTWKGFFEAFPDYKNYFEKIIKADDKVIVIGKSSCSYSDLDGPAIWTAKVKEEKVTEWRVYDDSTENRISLGI